MPVYYPEPYWPLTTASAPHSGGTYDGDGLRATKTTTLNGGTAQTTYFLYDGATPIAEETYSGTNASFSALNGWAADGWRARKQGNIVYQYVYDPQGSVMERQTDGSYSSGFAAYDRSTFEGYGALRRANKGSNGQGAGQHDPSGFGGQFGYYTDTETGLLCLTHRYYDPGTGRFINRDPIGYGGGMNLYGFAGGNPVNESDPSGLDWQEAHDTIKKYRNQITAAANQAGIQPLLLAGAVWGELYAGNVKGEHDRHAMRSRAGFISQLYSDHRKMNYSANWVGGYGSVGREVGASLGFVDMVKWPSRIPGGGSLSGRMKYVNFYESHPQYQLLDAGNLLHSLASRANRYPSHPGSLSPYQMSIFLTEYNKGHTNSTAANARPGPNGTIFSQNLTAIQNALNGK